MKGIMSLSNHHLQLQGLDNYCNNPQEGIISWEFNGNQGGVVVDPTTDEVVVWPVEHPTEPLDEDRPVKCPIPTSSFTTPTAPIPHHHHHHHVHAVKMEGRRSTHHHHRRSFESWRKRCSPKNPPISAMPIAIDQKAAAAADDDEGVILELAEAHQNLAVRKRHHTLSQQQHPPHHPNSEDVLRRMASLPPTTTNNNNNNTIFHMLQHASP